MSRARAFSPLAEQRWVTVALAFLKELEKAGTAWTKHQFCRWRRELGKRWRRKEWPNEKSKSKRERLSAAEGGGGGVDGVWSKRAIHHLDEKIHFDTWAICLPRWVLTTRTEFAWRLARSFFVKWRGQPPRTAALPLPAPFPGCLMEVAPSSARTS